MDATLPPSSMWERFPEIAVAILILAVFFAGFLLLWREYRKWSDAQDTTRRAWEAAQEKIREERWQGFMRDLQAEQAEDSERDRCQLKEMAEIIQQLSESVSKLTETVNNHIITDDARFSVLLDDVQKVKVAGYIQAGQAKSKEKR